MMRRHAVVWTGEKLVKVCLEPSGHDGGQTAGVTLLISADDAIGQGDVVCEGEFSSRDRRRSALS